MWATISDLTFVITRYYYIRFFHSFKKRRHNFLLFDPVENFSSRGFSYTVFREARTFWLKKLSIIQKLTNFIKIEKKRQKNLYTYFHPNVKNKAISRAKSASFRRFRFRSKFFCDFCEKFVCLDHISKAMACSECMKTNFISKK